MPAVSNPKVAGLLRRLIVPQLAVIGSIAGLSRTAVVLPEDDVVLDKEGAASSRFCAMTSALVRFVCVFGSGPPFGRVLSFSMGRTRTCSRQPAGC